MTSRGAWLSLTLVFIGGTAVGALGHRFFAMSSVEARTATARPSPEEFRKKYMTELRTRCKLTPEQETRVNGILDVTRNKFRALNDRQRPEFKAIQDEQTLLIRAVLDESQRAEYEKFREEREKARRERDAKNK